MARKLNRLTARQVATLKKPGRHADGGCLYLKICKTAAGMSRSWVFFYSINGRQREAGFGPIAAVSLAQARRMAAEWRVMLDRGGPLDERKAATAATAARKTFGECAADLIKSKGAEWRNSVHRRQWETTLEQYCSALWDTPVDEVDTSAVLSVLTPLWARIPAVNSLPTVTPFSRPIATPAERIDLSR